MIVIIYWSYCGNALLKVQEHYIPGTNCWIYKFRCINKQVSYHPLFSSVSPVLLIAAESLFPTQLFFCQSSLAFPSPPPTHGNLTFKFHYIIHLSDILLTVIYVIFIRDVDCTPWWFTLKCFHGNFTTREISSLSWVMKSASLRYVGFHYPRNLFSVLS